MTDVEDTAGTTARERALVLVGDSLLGWIDSDLTGDLEQRLEGWQVLNCATSGSTAPDCARRAPRLALTAPEAVLVSAGLDDAAGPGVSVEQYEQALVATLAAFEGARRMLLLPPHVIQARQEPGNGRPVRVLAEYRDAGRRACTATGARVIDGEQLARAVRARGEESHVDDGVHLAPALYRELIGHLARLTKG